MNRVDNARQGFLKKDLQAIKRAHNSNVVHSSLHHDEKHMNTFNLPQIILGGQDGLVNVLGILLGVAAATGSNQIVIIAGLSATFAESISMAAVAFTTKLAEADFYQSEQEREKYEIEHVPEGEKEEIRALYENYGFKGNVLDEIVEKITSDKKIWLKVMMEQELKLEFVDRKEALSSAIIVGFSAVIGSLIPLAPFFFLGAKSAMYLALFVTAMTLFAIGYFKARMTLGRNFLRMGLEMLVIGMVSALAGYIIGLLLQVK